MIDLKRVALFWKWFICPQCGGRNITAAKRTRLFTCRKCGCIFRSDPTKERTFVVEKGIESE